MQTLAHFYSPLIKLIMVLITPPPLNYLHNIWSETTTVNADNAFMNLLDMIIFSPLVECVLIVIKWALTLPDMASCHVIALFYFMFFGTSSYRFQYLKWPIYIASKCLGEKILKIQCYAIFFQPIFFQPQNGSNLAKIENIVFAFIIEKGFMIQMGSHAVFFWALPFRAKKW